MDGFYESERDMIQRCEVFYTEGCTPHFHTQVELLCVTTGKVAVTINGETRSVGVGELCVAGSYDVHAYAPEEGGKGLVLIFPFAYLRKYFALTENRVITQHFLQNAALCDAIVQLAKLFMAAQCKNELFEEGFSDTVMGLLYDSLRFAPAEVDGKVETIRSVLTYIHAHYNEDLSLQKSARRFGYSPYHFSRLFRSFTNVGFKQYVNLVRLQKAAIRLQNGEDVTNAALDSGFNSMRSFYRDFTAQYGVTPRKYINCAAREEGQEI